MYIWHICVRRKTVLYIKMKLDLAYENNYFTYHCIFSNIKKVPNSRYMGHRCRIIHFSADDNIGIDLLR